MKPITICMTYFRGLQLANLEAALYSVRRQDFAHVEEVVLLDNNTTDPEDAIHALVEQLEFPLPVFVQSCKHGDITKTHSWSTNAAVRRAQTPWVFFTRADYLLSFDAVEKCWEAQGDNRFIVGGYWDVSMDIERCNRTSWREHGPRVLQTYGNQQHHMVIDSGVWMTTRDIFDRAGGMEESLSAWGHAQTVLQWRVHQLGVEFIHIDPIIYYHPDHFYAGNRDHGEAILQLEKLGIDLREMWARYDGPNKPY